MDLFEEKLGFRPTGMWPSEEAVSPAMVEPVSDVGIQWMVTDEEILMKSTDVNGNFIDVDVASNLATPWLVTGSDGGEVATVFRDRVISDRIAFQYGTMTPEAAVSDFIAYLDNIRLHSQLRIQAHQTAQRPSVITTTLTISTTQLHQTVSQLSKLVGLTK